MAEKFEVDLVYTWVTSEDPEYVELCRSYADNPNDINPERYRDTYELLKFSLRSFEKYLNWYRKIFIVTARPQIPDWLDQSNPNIEVIHHDQIIDEEYLPTFNQNCIESYLHKIPGLAKHFIYINDDFLFGSKTDFEDFYSNGKYRIFNTVVGENLGWRIYDGKNDLIGLGLIEHTPLFINADFWSKMLEVFPTKQATSREHKFRQPEDLLTYKLYRYYMLKFQRHLSKPIKVWDLLKINTFHKITNKLSKQKKSIAKLEKKKPKFYCLNDDQRDNPNLEVVALIKDFLQRNYPEKSAFEL